MVSFIHCADLHLGLRVTRFEKRYADKIREARIKALENVLSVATENNVDFILIAGDLFDDPAVDSVTARRAYDLLSQGSPVPVFVLPGNHDPLLPGSMWDRKPWDKDVPSKLMVLRGREPVVILKDIKLFPCPLFRRTSLEDPTAWIPPIPESRKRIRIGIAHGSLKDRDNLPDDDHLIDKIAATQRGLDYLALGHWHTKHLFKDAEGVVRTAYPGVHEPMRFREGQDTGVGWSAYATDGLREEFQDKGPGEALLVRISAPGKAPEIEAYNVGYLNWVTEQQRLMSEEDVSEFIKKVAGRRNSERTLIRVALEGTLSANALLKLDDLDALLSGRYLYSETDKHSLHLLPEDSEVREMVGQGVLQAVYKRLEHETHAVEGAEDSESVHRQELAKRAILLLYRIAKEIER